MMRRFAAFVFLLLCFGCTSRRHETAPLSPEQALASFHLDPDFRIELYAAEPYVVDPVELVWDENGLAYVAEMRDYPEDPPKGKPPRSRIRILEDTDGDGRIDRATIFADQLLEVTSILPWKGGVIVCAAPDILYLKDTDGDRRADVRKVLFTGFALVNPESRITNLRLSVDNWVYASNNGQQGEIRFAERPEAAPVSVVGADFRFRLDRGLFEAESGPTQFGQALDDWGNRFITDNTVHIRNVALPRRYLGRNPFLPAGEVAQDISDHGRPSARMFPLTRPQRWREMRTDRRQQRYRDQGLERTRPLNPSTEIVGGFFTGAAGGTIYSGDSFPEPYRGNYFVGDVSGNLVHRDILQANGVSFTASRGPADQTREFLASTDPWFRPCNFATGPDGNLYVVDMYREFIETPESIPEDIKRDLNFWSGDTMGRIYRIAPKTAAPVRKPAVAIGRASSAELVRLLDHPNGWWRSTAQRLILERQDHTIVPMLRTMVKEGKTPQARLRALSSLEGLDALDSAILSGRMSDPEPELREHAVRLAEKFPDLVNGVTNLAGDAAPRVQLQVALSLGEFLMKLPIAQARPMVETLARLAAEHGAERWFRIAILSSTISQTVPLLEAVVADRRFFAEPGVERSRFVGDLAGIVGARREPAEVESLLRLAARAPALAQETWQVAVLEGLGRGLRLADVTRLRVGSAESVIEKWLASPSEKVQTAARNVARHLELRSFMDLARREAVDHGLPVSRREAAIAALGSGNLAEMRPIFEQLISTESDPMLLRATISALGSFEDASVPEIFIGRWSTLGPAARAAALDTLLDRRSMIPMVLAAVENGRVERAAFDLQHKEKLIENPDAGVSARARKLFGEAEQNRQRVVDAYRASIREPGDSSRGKAVFEKNCAICHLQRRGRRIGPDLSGVSSRTRAQLLDDILNPSREIQARFRNYLVTTRDGRMLDGLIVAETPGTITLRRAEGDDEVMLRSNVSGIRASILSLMPDGFEASLSKQDLADLIAFLQGVNLSASK